MIIAKAGKRYFDLTLCRELMPVRKPGSLRGKIRIADDSDGTSDELIEAFEGGT